MNPPRIQEQLDRSRKQLDLAWDDIQATHLTLERLHLAMTMLLTELAELQPKIAKTKEDVLP